jgi:5-methylcytosine-specific restriction endonuclease McrA
MAIPNAKLSKVKPQRCANILGHGQTKEESNMNEYKTCSKCRQEKTLESFSKHNGKKSAKSGHRASCKACDVEYNRLYRERNREKVNENKRRWAKENRHLLRPGDARFREQNRDRIREYHAEWRLKNLDVIKAYQKQYALDNREKKALLDKLWAQNNKDRVNAASRRYRAKHPEKVAQIKRAQATKHPETVRNNSLRRRARLVQNGIYLVTKKDIARIIANPCVYCGSKAEHIDHVIPIAKGGAHKVGNLVAACQSCNQRKSDKFLSFWKAGR